MLSKEQAHNIQVILCFHSTAFTTCDLLLVPRSSMFLFSHRIDLSETQNEFIISYRELFDIELDTIKLPRE